MSYCLLIFGFIQFWLSPPEVQAAEKLGTLEVIYAFEMIMVHSGIMMTLFTRKWSLIILFPFYGLFVLGLHLSVPGSQFLYIYLGIVFVRIRFAFSNPSRLETNINGSLSFFGVLNYFIAAFIAAIFSKQIPKLGLNEAYFERVGYSYETGGAVLHAPHHFVALLIIYFTFFMLAEVYAIFFRRKHSRNIS